MRVNRLAGLFVMMIAVGPVARAQQETTDRKAIEAVVETWNRGWETKDPKLAASGYSADADWTNAFGFYNKGHAAIEQFLRGVFELPFVMGAESRVAQQEIRFLAPHIALVRTVVERTGQTTPDGQALGIRNTSHLRVFHKVGEEWQIVSHLISDARDRAAPRH